MKLLLREQGSDHARELWNTDEDVITSWITHAESCAALEAARRAGRITHSQLRIHRAQLARDWYALTAIDADEPVVRLAGTLTTRHRLRGMDAIHLATALLVRAARPLVVTWDGDLAAAARGEGLAVTGAA